MVTSDRIKLKLAFTLLVSLVGLCGCVHEYLLKLNNGGQIISISKPKLQGTNYFFTDRMGQRCVIPQTQVLKVRGVSLVKEPEKPWSPAAPKQPKHWYFLWLA